jgi:lantibiotic modifying enzyme
VRVVRATLDDEEVEIGGFSGVLSDLYVLSHLAALWNDPALLPPLGPILDRVQAKAKTDQKFDVIYGASGSILALVTIHALTGSEQALAIAAAAARRIQAAAQRSAAGVSWPCGVSTRNLLGFSHGAAGVGSALLRLARAAAGGGLDVDPAALVALAEEGFAYERSHFDPTAGNWPDLRDTLSEPDKPRFMLAYCHGAPGIALSRLPAPSLDPGTPARRDVELAIGTTLAGRVQEGHTLCHGELGNMMIAHRAAALLGRDDWQRRIDERLPVTLARLFERGPECNFDFPPAAPALMSGLAGIGYGLLYLARPAEVPFVLDISPAAALIARP